jgi:hypothetical protein
MYSDRSLRATRRHGLRISGPVDTGLLVPAAAGVVFIIGFVGVYLHSLKKNRARLASLEAIWSRATEVVAAAPPGAEPIPAVLTGRPALAYHVEVVAKETVGRGNYEEIITRRIHEESNGAFAAPDGTVDFSDASLTTEADTDFGGAVVYSSATSMFAGKQQIPPPVYAFLAHRDLPLPRQDQMFAAGYKVVIRERIVTPGTQLWIAAARDEILFDLGSIADARRLAMSKQANPLFESLIGGVILGAIAGMIGSFAFQILSK